MRGAHQISALIAVLVIAGALHAQQRPGENSFRNNMSVGLFKEMSSLRDFISPFRFGVIVPVSEAVEFHTRFGYRDTRWDIGDYIFETGFGLFDWSDPYSAIDYHIAAIYHAGERRGFALELGAFFSAVHIVEGDQGFFESLRKASFSAGSWETGAIIGAAWSPDTRWRISVQYRPMIVVTTKETNSLLWHPDRMTEFQVPLIMHIAFKPF